MVRMSMDPGWARPWNGVLDLLWRAPLVVPALLMLIAVVLYWKTLEWHDG